MALMPPDGTPGDERRRVRRLLTSSDIALEALERIEAVYTTMEGTAAMERVREIALDARRRLRAAEQPSSRWARVADDA
jgi:peptide subunit release factor 1 (eRF1)